jgi:O-Antigen ligase
MIENRLRTRSLQRQKNLFFFTALLCVAIPGFAALKAIAIIGAWAYITCADRVRNRSIIWFLSVLLNVVFCSEIALLHGVSPADTAGQLSRVVLFFLALGLGVSIAESRAFDDKTTDRLIFWMALISAILKIALMWVILTGRLSIDSVQSTLGFETVTDDIGFGLQRLQFPSDIALTFLLACYTGGRRKIVDVLFLISITINVFLSFSRFLFVAYLACLVIRFFRVRKFDTVSITALSATVIVVAVFSVTLANRFVSAGSQASDSTRTEQIEYLSAAIVEHPFLGTGIGSSVNSYKRSGTIPFSYEVQWYAMAMQFGFLGLAWFFANLIASLWICFKQPGRRAVFLAIFLLWVFAGFTNPLIVSLGSAFGLCVLAIALTNDLASRPKPLAHGRKALQA